LHMGAVVSAWAQSTSRMVAPLPCLVVAQKEAMCCMRVAAQSLGPRNVGSLLGPSGLRLVDELCCLQVG
jgi:hypothetical protein